jgi:hypothetical protein
MHNLIDFTTFCSGRQAKIQICKEELFICNVLIAPPSNKLYLPLLNLTRIRGDSAMTLCSVGRVSKLLLFRGHCEERSAIFAATKQSSIIRLIITCMKNYYGNIVFSIFLKIASGWEMHPTLAMTT